MTGPDDDPRREVASEFDFHLEMRTREYQARGLTRAEARRRATREFGDRAAAEAACRDYAEARDQRHRRQAVWASAADDLREAVRGLRRRPAAPVAIFGMLTIGIALSIAALALSWAVLRAKPPYPDAASAVALQGRLTQEGRTQNWPGGYLDMVDLQAEVRPHLLLAAHSAARPLNLLTSGGAEVVHAEMVSASYFAVLGLAAAQGRVFTEQEDQRAAAAPVAVLSDEFWRNRRGGDPGIIGASIVLNERSYTVVGVMPRGIRGITDRADLWLPVNAGAAIYSPAYIEARQLRWVSLIGRLGAGVTLAQGADVLRAGSEELGRRFPQDNGGLIFQPLPLEERIFGTLPLSLHAASAGAALVMLLVFVNIGGLSLARAVVSERDLVVKRALGAQPSRLFRQACVQWLLVAAAAAVSAVALARGVLQAVLASGAFRLPSFVEPALSGNLLLAAPLFALAGALVAAAAPVIFAMRTDLALGATTARSTASPAVRRMGQAVIFTQVGVAVALLFTGVLMVRTVLHLQWGALGWIAEGTAAMRIDLLGQRYASDPVKQRFAEEFLDRLSRRAQVPAALSGPGGVPTGELFLTRLTIEDYRPATGDARPFVSWHTVTPGFFEVLGIELRSGRLFTDGDRAGAQLVVIVTESFGRRFWPGVDPVGRRLGGSRDNPAIPWAVVVGVVKDVDFEAHSRERDVAPHEHVFIPFAQRAPSNPSRAHLLVKGGDVSRVAAAARETLQEIAPTLPLHPPILLKEALARQTARDRLVAAILAFFGATALIVSVLGIYCTVAFEVARRAPEYGLRLALGAARAHIVRLATLETVLVTGGGVAAGVVAGVTLGRLGEALLFDVRPLDVRTTALVVFVLVVAAAVGMWRPIRRAATTDPATVLRQN